MPKVIAVGSHSSTAWLARLVELLMARLGWMAGRVPAGVTPTLGPDATGVGWVYQYAVMASKRNLAELRTTQDWQVRFAVAKAEGVAEAASAGGFVRQYSVVVDPRRLRAFDIPLSDFFAIFAEIDAQAVGPGS